METTLDHLDSMSDGDLIAAMEAAPDLSERELVLLDRLTRACAALADAEPATA